MSTDEFIVQAGAFVRTQQDDKIIQITHLLDMKRIVGRYLDGGEPHIFDVAGLKPEKIQKGVPGIASISEKGWEEAKKMLAVIAPLMDDSVRTKAKVVEAAKKIGKDVATLYRWIKKYRRTMTLASLVRETPDGGENGSRLDPRVQAVIMNVIGGEGLTPQQCKPKKLHRIITKRCKALGLKPPHINTVRNRMKQIPRALYESSRRGKEAGDKYEPMPGEYTEAKWPLQIIQIDHTPLDVIVVDDEERKPIGRAFLTVAIDVFSRTVVGYFISLDHPGDHSVGLCLVDAILPKDQKLAKYKIDTPCPVYGKMTLVHADNAGEFRGDMLKRAGENRNIDIQWRPVKKARYGAHIERLCGTLNHALKEVPGATFSNPDERGDYDSDGMAAMSMDELQEWIAVRIYTIYHVSIHSGLGTTPMRVYEEAIMGVNGKPGRGLPARIIDERRLRIEFLPYEKRTVQQYGIEWDQLTYYADAVRTWIHAQDPESPKKKRKFIVHRDPRDISVLFFYDPEMREYYDVPYGNPTRPKISLWELRAAAKYLEETNAEVVDEEALFAAHERLLQIEESSVAKTRKARRTAQARKSRIKSLEDHPIPRKNKDAPRIGPSNAQSAGIGIVKSSTLSDVIPAGYDVAE